MGIDGFSIGPLYVHFYGIIVMLGAFAGGLLASREAKRRGHNPEIIWDLMIYLIVSRMRYAPMAHLHPVTILCGGRTYHGLLSHTSH